MIWLGLYQVIGASKDTEQESKADRFYIALLNSWQCIDLQGVAKVPHHQIFLIFI